MEATVNYVISCPVLLATLLAGSAAAQESAAAPKDQDAVQILSKWTYNELYYSGFSVNEVLEQTVVVNPDNEAIGNLDNLVFRDDGALVAAIAEIGGFAGVGGQHVRIPWDEVTLADDVSRLQVPVTEESVGEYPMFGDFLLDLEEGDARGPAEGAEEATLVGEEARTGSGAFKATDLIGDLAYFSDQEPSGYVRDLIVVDGAISALVIEPEGGDFISQYYAYPYIENGGGPSSRYGPRYDLPYEGQQIDTLDDFDYDALQRRGG
jgi:hypothetical protein